MPQCFLKYSLLSQKKKRRKRKKNLDFVFILFQERGWNTIKNDFF